MIWWVTCFVATVVTIVAKWYFTTAVERLRQTLLHEQREALSLKGELSDLRQDQRGKGRLVRESEADIKRLKSSIAQLQGEIHGLEDELKGNH
jgi:septal ring factor EnvC (AmiA/AmiB activator)